MHVLALLMWFQLGSGEAPAELQRAVTQYWELLASGDRSAALEYVAPESRNAFINRPVRLPRSWRLDKLEEVASDKFLSQVTLEAFTAVGLQTHRVAEHWRLHEGEWLVEISDQPTGLKAIFESAPLRPRPGVLQVLPHRLKIHYLSPNQKGGILISNGTTEPASLVRLEYDTARFEVLETVETVPAGTVGRLSLKFTGTRTTESHDSQVTLVLKHGSDEKTFEIPITYNYISSGARAILKLSSRETAPGKPGDPTILQQDIDAESSRDMRADEARSQGRTKKEPRL